MGIGKKKGWFRKQGGFDADAQAFITAAGITDSTQQTAINTLVVGLKADSLWAKMSAIYPFVGGTATTHKYNLKDPRDLDAAFRLVFTAGWTHNSSGATPNGTTAYADSKISISSVLSQNDSAGGSYINGGNATYTNVLFGASDSGFAQGFYALHISTTGGNNYSRHNGSTAVGGLDFTGARGLFTINRTISTSFNCYKNTSKVIKIAGSSGRTANNIWIGGLNNNGSLVEPSDNTQAFCYFSDGLSDADVSNLYTLVQAFQTTLSRQV